MIDYIKEEEAKLNLERQERAKEYHRRRVEEEMAKKAERQQQREREREMLKKEKQLLVEELEREKRRVLESFELEKKKVRELSERSRENSVNVSLSLNSPLNLSIHRGSRMRADSKLNKSIDLGERLFGFGTPNKSRNPSISPGPTIPEEVDLNGKIFSTPKRPSIAVKEKQTVGVTQTTSFFSNNIKITS
mgnify:FL=1